MRAEKEGSLPELRFGRAEEALDAGRLLLDAGHSGGAAERAYFAVFYAMRALLALRGRRGSREADLFLEDVRAYLKSV